jgi:hypothetical protein
MPCALTLDIKCKVNDLSHCPREKVLSRDVLHHMRRAGYVFVEETTANNNKSKRPIACEANPKVCPLQYVLGCPAG